MFESLFDRFGDGRQPRVPEVVAEVDYTVLLTSGKLIEVERRGFYGEVEDGLVSQL